MPGKRASLESAIAQLEGHEEPDHLAVLDGLPVLDRVFGPLIKSIVSALPHNEDAWIENALDLLNYPGYMRSVADYFAGRVFYAMLGFTLGIVLGIEQALLFDSSSLFMGLLILPLGLSLLGYWTPKLTLISRLKARCDLMLFDAPYVFDRLAVAVMSNHNDLLEGMKGMVADDETSREQQQAEADVATRLSLIKATSVPEGGYLMRELRLVAERSMHGMSVAESFYEMAERNTDVPLIEQFCSRMSVLHPSGLSVVDSLRALGDRAAEMVEDAIETRSAQNEAMMIVPTFIALIGMGAVIVGPSIAILTGGF